MNHIFIRIQINEPASFVDGENCTVEDISYFRVIVPYRLIDGIIILYSFDLYISQAEDNFFFALARSFFFFVVTLYNEL